MFLPTLSDATVIAIAALGAVLLILCIWVVRLEIKIRAFTKGADGGSLEDSIRSSRQRIEAIEIFRKNLETYLTSVEKRLKRSVQGVSTVRFNPWKGAGEGGNQSFAMALLDEEGNGVVISTLSARERMSVFAKPVKNNTPQFDLTNEEAGALKEAREATQR